MWPQIVRADIKLDWPLSLVFKYRLIVQVFRYFIDKLTGPIAGISAV